MKNPSVNSIVERLEDHAAASRAAALNPPSPTTSSGWLQAARDFSEAATIISGLQATVARIKTQRDNALLDMEKFMNVVTDCCGILGLADDNYTELPASLSRIKAETIEECAKVAEKDRRSELAVKYDYMPDFQKCAIYIAEEIRSLGSTGGHKAVAG